MTYREASHVLAFFMPDSGESPSEDGLVKSIGKPNLPIELFGENVNTRLIKILAIK